MLVMLWEESLIGTYVVETPWSQTFWKASGEEEASEEGKSYVLMMNTVGLIVCAALTDTDK